MTLPVSVKALCYNALTVFHAPPPTRTHQSGVRPSFLPSKQSFNYLRKLLWCVFLFMKNPVGLANAFAVASARFFIAKPIMLLLSEMFS